MRGDNRRPRVLVCDPVAQEGIELLREAADVDVRTDLGPEDLLAAVADYEALVVRSATQVTRDVIEHGLHLKVIGRAGSGLDNIDVSAAQAHGVEVVNSPDANTLAVAEHTMGLLLALARRLPRADLSLKAGKWEKKALIGTGLAGKTLGIVGFGRIGREVAIRARAFGMSVLVNQRRHTPELDLEPEVEAVDLDELLARSDFVTLHVPLKPETEGLIGAEQLGRMRPRAYLINTARGRLVDENALLEALDEERIGGAALDVFHEEPAPNSALVRHERVIATPHIAASTEDAKREAALTVARAVLDRLRQVEVESVLPLRVVPLARVFAHEHTDPQRVANLAARLEAEGALGNPPIVVETDERYMVLDGATRVAALKQLGVPHVVVQATSVEDGLRLSTWYHAVRGAPVDQLLEALSGLADVSLSPSTPEDAPDAMFEYGGLCFMHTVRDEVFLVEPAPGANRLDALNAFTNRYIGMAHVARTLDSDLIKLQHEYPDLSALVVFPEYTVPQVVQAAQTGRRFSAGITRFIVPGRVLRLGVPLDKLNEDASLGAKNRWLHELLLEKQRRGAIRHYAETVTLLDE